MEIREDGIVLEYEDEMSAEEIWDIEIEGLKEALKRIVRELYELIDLSE